MKKKYMSPEAKAFDFVMENGILTMSSGCSNSLDPGSVNVQLVHRKDMWGNDIW